MKALTAHELVELLTKHVDPNAEVAIEGCDCIGAAVGITVDSDGVLIARSNPEFYPPKSAEERQEELRQELQAQQEAQARDRALRERWGALWPSSQ